MWPEETMKLLVLLTWRPWHSLPCGDGEKAPDKPEVGGQN